MSDDNGAGGKTNKVLVNRITFYVLSFVLILIYYDIAMLRRSLYDMIMNVKTVMRSRLCESFILVCNIHSERIGAVSIRVSDFCFFSSHSRFFCF